MHEIPVIAFGRENTELRDEPRHSFSLSLLATPGQVLLSDPENVKGLFRAGQLHLRLKNLLAAKVGACD